MLTDEKREQLQLIQRCDPSFLLLSVKEHTNFDSALLEKVFELAKEQTRSLLAASAAPAKVDNWQQYAKEGETAQRCIERHRAEQDALLKLYGRAAPAEGREAFEEFAKERMLDVQPSVLGGDYVSFITNLVWAGWKGHAALATAPTMSEAANSALVEAVMNYIGALDAWDGSVKAERYTKRKEIAMRAALAEVRREPPSDCSGDPTNCPDNEGRGCFCSDKERIDRAAAKGESDGPASD